MRESTDHRYLLADAAPAGEVERLDAIDELMGPITQRRIERLGITTGWRCLEVGAGTGGVALWMAERVGKTGLVTAIDVTPRIEPDRACPQLVVRQHDILEAGLQADHYELVHCRLLLANVGNVELALRRMVEALRPGGWLVVEEPGDGRPPEAGQASPAVAEFNRLYEEFLASVQRASAAVELDLSRRLPGLLEKAGLEDLGGDVTHVLATGPGRKALAGTLRSVGPLLGGTPFETEGKLARLTELAAEPALLATAGATLGLWGRWPR